MDNEIKKEVIMGQTPTSTNKPKYNKSKPYEWVDSQWEKFMIEQRDLKARIFDLEQQYATDGEYISHLEDEVDRLKEQQSKQLSEEISSDQYFADENHDRYIYESPDGGKTLYRRKFGDYDSPREKVFEKEPKPITREQAETRLKYLNTEIAHDSYYDGWTLNGMKQERDWLLSELRRLDSENNQLELFPPTNDA
jgi:hypothetical protein